MPDDYDLRNAIYTPQQSATYSVQAAEQARANKNVGLSMPIPVLGDYFAPLAPGQVCAIIAQTSHYKSGFLHFLEHESAKRLMAEGREDEIIIHVSVEECVEEQTFLELARYSSEDAGGLAVGRIQDWDRLMKAAMEVGLIPIYRIGDSLARAEDMPNLYMSNMIRAIKLLVEELLDWRPKVAGLFFDYLQAFPYDPEHNDLHIEGKRRLQVREDIYRLRQAAAYFKCPVFVAVQAKQHLEGANPPIMLPGIYDGEESSSIAQRCDRILSLWMPKNTHALGSTITAGSSSYLVEENSLWIKVAKQRGGLPSTKIFRCRIDFRTNSITMVDDK